MTKQVKGLQDAVFGAKATPAQKSDTTTRIARGIADAERAALDAKTARLRALRLAQEEAAPPPPPASVKKRAKR